MKTTGILGLLAATLLAGCGGDATTFNTRLSAAENLIDIIDAAGVTPIASMPSGGDANYTGTALLEINEVDYFIGNADISVDFDTPAAAASGSLTSFVDESDVAAPGTLAITGGVITDNSMAMNAAGTLNLPSGGTPGPATIDIDLLTAFSGPSAEYITAIGTTVGSGGTDPDRSALIVVAD